MYTLYILYSSKFDKTYVGYTNDLTRRLHEHNFLAIRGYTIRFRPWMILHSEIFESKQEAMLREKYYKTGAGREAIKKFVSSYLDRYPPEAEKD